MPVTAKRDAEDWTLCESERVYRLVVESSPNAMLLVGNDGRITLVNSRTEGLWGYPRAELLGQPFEMLFPERSRADLAALREGCSIDPAAHAVGVGGDLFVLRRDASEIAVQIALNPIRAREGGLVVSILDITERKKSEEYSQLFRILVERVKDYAIFMLDPRGFVLTWNEGAARIKGYLASEIVGKHFSVFYAPRDVQSGRPEAALEMAGVHGEYHEEGFRMRKDGRKFHASVVITALRNGDGSIRGYSKIVRDITERKAAAIAVRERERELRLLADAMPQIVWTARPDGYVNYYNQRWYDFTGFAEGEGGDESWKPILHPDDLHPCLDAWYSAVGSGYPYEIELRFRDRISGLWRWHLTRALPVRDDGGNILKWIGTCTDIDDHKRLSEELEQRVEQRTLDLRRSLEEKTTLLKEVHHRVKNNLQVVCSLLSMQIECTGESTSPDPLRAAHQRVLAMSLIHEQLYQSNTLSDLDFGAYIELLSGQLFQAYCVDPARIRLETSAEPIPIVIDHAIPCGLILNELVSNSLKHAFPGGRAGVIRVRFRRIGRARAELSIADDGIGLPSDFRCDDSHSLGLQVTRTLVAQLKGELHVSGEGGATFSFDWDPGDATGQSATA